MAYPIFHQPHPELADVGILSEPVFHDTDNSPLYEDPYQGLLRDIVAANDVAALRLYHANPNTRVFWEEYEIPSWHPFLVAKAYGSCDVLRALLEIYLSDPVYQLPEYPPLEEYLARWKFSPIHMACTSADRGLTLWLLSEKQQNGGERPLATLRDPGYGYGGRTPLVCAVSGLRRHGRDVERREAFICFLLDELGCKVQDSDFYCSSVQGQGQQSRDRVRRADDDDHDANAHEEEDAEEGEFIYTVLGAAIPYASYRMTARLIAAGADVHARQSWSDTYRWTPDECIIKDSKGVTAAHIASLYGNIEGLRALVDYRGRASVAEMMARADDQGRLPLHWALLGAMDERPHTSEAEDGTTPRSRRIIDTVKWLLNANPYTINACDWQGATVLTYAVKSRAAGTAGILAAVKVLLDARPRSLTLNHIPDTTAATRTSTFLQDLVTYHSRRSNKVRDEHFTELIETFLEHRADPRLCLHRLCAGIWHDPISLSILDRLLEPPADINDTDADGCTAMHYVTRHLDQIEAARHLISRGADVSVVNHKGNTPLHELMKGTMFRRLDEHGKPDPAQPRDAPARVREEWIKVLVEAGGSMNQSNTAGQTPAQLLDALNDRIQRNRQAEASRGGRRGRCRG